MTKLQQFTHFLILLMGLLDERFHCLYAVAMAVTQKLPNTRVYEQQL